MKDIKVSIIIPAYNAEKLISKTLESLVSQTLNGFEVITVNDGSKDQTLNILNNYKKMYPDIIKVIDQKNGGPSKARNAALKIAKGEYIGFVDADDYVESTFLEKMVTKADKYKSDLIVIGRNNVYKNGKIVQKLPNKNLNKNNIFNFPQLLNQISPFIWDKLYRKEIIIKNKILFDETLNYAEDYLFLSTYLFYSSTINTIHEPLYYYNTDQNNSITNTFNKRMLHIPDALTKVNEFYISVGYFDNFESHLYYNHMHFFRRRLNAFETQKNKKLQLELSNKFINMFKEYFPAYYGIHEDITYKKVLCKIFKPKFTFKLNKIKRKLIRSQNTYKYAYYRKFFSIENDSVLFISNSGRGIIGNPYYMLKKLSQQEKNKTIYVVVYEIEKVKKYLHNNKIDNVKIVRMNSKSFLKLLATANYIITNSKVPNMFNKRDGQVYINTWHGTPLKTLGGDLKSGISDLGNTQSQFLMADYLVMPNEFTKEKINQSFFLEKIYNGKFIVEGYPRNSIFFSNDNNYELKRKLGGRRKENYSIYAYLAR